MQLQQIFQSFKHTICQPSAVEACWLNQWGHGFCGATSAFSHLAPLPHATSHVALDQ